MLNLLFQITKHEEYTRESKYWNKYLNKQPQSFIYLNLNIYFTYKIRHIGTYSITYY